MASLDYAKAGVDIKAAEVLVDKISAITKRTLNRKVKAAIGGYASLFEIDKGRWLAASTDGVGTKLKLAFALNKHDTVGIDLVAMSVNDILCVGAEPLFFLDYFGTGKLDVKVGQEVLRGVVEGCAIAGCALVGGETAEMPGFYEKGEYDLAGFAVGVVKPSDVLPKKEIRVGDVLVGLASSGCHSNGYSLLRKLIPSGKKGKAVAKQLLTPTKIYTAAVLPLIKKKLVKGLAHITGSGFLNVPRMSDKVSYEIELPPIKERASVYAWLYERSGLSFADLAKTLNLGIGMVAVVERSKVKTVLKGLQRRGEKAWIIGNVVKRQKGFSSQVFISDRTEFAILDY